MREKKNYNFFLISQKAEIYEKVKTKKKNPTQKTNNDKK